MKKTSLTIAIAAFLGALSFFSCNKECEYYMEGKKCDKEVREKYYGTYVGIATSNSTSGNAYFEVSSHPDGPEYFKISTLTAKLTTATAFNIPLQNYYANVTYQVEGSGSFSNDQLTLNFVRTYQGQTTVVSFTGTK